MPTLTTDKTGYASAELDPGTYLVIEEPSDKVFGTADPVYVTLKSGVTTIEELHPVNKPGDEPGEVSVALQVTKEINDWGEADSFSFKLAGQNNAPMPAETTAKATKDDPVAVFGRITYKEAGTYTYTITEVDEGLSGIIYDTTPHKVTVTVTEQQTLVGQNSFGNDVYRTDLVAEVKYDGEENLTVVNTSEESTEETTTEPDVTTTDTPKVGDSGDMTRWMLILAVSLLGVCALVGVLLRKEQKI